MSTDGEEKTEKQATLIEEQTPQRSAHRKLPPELREIKIPVDYKANMLRLLEDPPSSKTIGVLDDLFAFWGIESYPDLEVFGRSDALDYFKGQTNPASVLIQKKIGYMVEYACYGAITDSITMRDIIGMVDKPANDAKPASSPTPVVGQAQKKTVPTLEHFSGLDEDYYTWRDSVINDLGQAGLATFVVDKTAHTANKDLSESVFFAMRKAVTGGIANTAATAKYDTKDFNPFELWNELAQYYDTPINKTNINVYETRKLLSLVLDESTTPLQFVSDMRNCLLRLKRHKAQLHSDEETLKAFLLVAIRDPDFDKIRDSIVDNPKRGMHDLLEDICCRDASLQLKEGVRSLQGETPGAISRRTATKQPGKSRVHKDIKNGRWVIPTFPPGWSKAIGPKIFKILTDWRKSAIFQHTLQKGLDEAFGLRVDNIPQGNLKRTPKYSRRADITMDIEDGDVQFEEPDAKPSAKAGKRRRISLAKSNRVITESSTKQE